MPVQTLLSYLKGQRWPKWYGMYLMDRKVGFMKEAWRVDGDEVVYTNSNVLKVQVMGSSKEAEVRLTIRYSAGDGAFKSLEALEKLPGMTRHVTIRSKGNGIFESTTEISGPSMPQPHKEVKTLKGAISPLQSSALAVEYLIGRSDQGKWVTKTFNYQNQRFGREGYFIRRTVTRVINGIKTRLKVVDYLSEVQGLTMATIFSDAGDMLYGSVGGQLILKLEDERRAKSLNGRFDMGFGTMIPMKFSHDPRTLKYLKLRIVGRFPSPKFLNEQRYTLTRKGQNEAVLELRVDSLDGLRLPRKLPEEVRAYLKAEPGIESDDPELRKFAMEHAGAGDALAKVRRLTMFVGDYVQDVLTAESSSALVIMRHPRGDCSEHALLLTALLRAIGIPARMVAGVGYVGGAASAFGYHAWVQVYLGRWIDVDPTWKQVPADVTHILLGTPTHVSWLSSIGNMKFEVLEEK